MGTGDEEQEAIRNLLTRVCDDLKAQERKARQQLNAYVLRYGHAWPPNKTRWTKTHYAWLESLKFAYDWQQLVLQEYIDAVKAGKPTGRRHHRTDGTRVLPQWSLAPVVDSLVALRGIDKLAAIVSLAELGDISRFDGPQQLLAYLRVWYGANTPAVVIVRELAGFIWDNVYHWMPKVQQTIEIISRGIASIT